MTYTLQQDGFVIRESDGACIPPDPLNSDYAIYLLWLDEGNQPAVPEGPSQEAMIKGLTDAVQALMDAKARSYNYDDLTTAVTYADEPAVPKFQKEGQAFRAWRSLVWDSCYAYLASVQAGIKPFPTIDELPSLVPAFSLDSGG